MGDEPWAFAKKYTIDDMADDEKRQAFLLEVCEWEGRFVRGPGVHASGLTRDGVQVTHGQLKERNWSAPSKEALHIAILAKRVAAKSSLDLLAEAVMPYEEAIDALTKKIALFEQFREKHARFHGYLPWFLSENLEPSDGWKKKFPILDNGQLAWALYSAVNALGDAGEAELAERYGQHLTVMARHAPLVGYGGDGKISRCCKRKPAEGDEDGELQYVQEGIDSDPFETELFVLFLDLFGDFRYAGWKDPDKEKALIWNFEKRHCRIRRAQLDLGHGGPGPIDCVAGWHFSSHELWKHLQAPYRSVPCTHRLLLNGERARTHYAAVKGVPGMWASCSKPGGAYVDSVGVAEGLSDMSESKTDLFTPYGAFPTIMADEATGAAWYKNMLDAAGMQSEFGSYESVTCDREVCEMLTWDAKITTLLAILGGGDDNEKYLRRDGLWDRFEHILETMYGSKFEGALAGEELPFALPTASLTP